MTGAKKRKQPTDSSDVSSTYFKNSSSKIGDTSFNTAFSRDSSTDVGSPLVPSESAWPKRVIVRLQEYWQIIIICIGVMSGYVYVNNVEHKADSAIVGVSENKSEIKSLNVKSTEMDKDIMKNQIDIKYSMENISSVKSEVDKIKDDVVEIKVKK
ncbi:hypothetical protein KW543_18460 [Vibrio fluvialis]|nr:hypothetical protein [Vibrio fluvialis]